MDNSNREEFAKLFYAMGGIDRDFAAFIGVTEPTIHNWKKKHKEFSMAVKLGKINPDTKVESALYHSAIEGSNTAQIFWLKNRKPTDWRDRQEIEITEHHIKVSRKTIESDS